MAKTDEQIKAEQTADAKKAAKAPKLEVDAAIGVVHANGSRMTGKITAVRNAKAGLVDLLADDGSKDGVVITSSPNDPSGTAPDSWHFPIEGND